MFPSDYPGSYPGGANPVTKTSGLGDRLFVAGRNVSGDIGSLGKIGGGPAALEMTGIDKEAFERIGGLRDGGIDFSAYFNPGIEAYAAHAVFSALPTADQIVTYCRGVALGGPGAACVSKQLDYPGKRGNDGAFTFDISVQANGYGVECNGVQLTAGIRTDTTATNGAGLDLGSTPASYSFGAQAYLQVFTLTGTSVTVKVQDSADNVTFADVAGLTFGAAAGTGAQRIETGRGQTVRRYVRAVTTGTFTNTQIHVLFVRNDVDTRF